MMDWRERAACAPGSGTDPELFFPVDGARRESRAEILRVGRAKAVCADCPVTRQCLQFAMDHALVYGVWGGLDEDQLKNLRRRRNAHRRAALIGEEEPVYADA